MHGINPFMDLSRRFLVLDFAMRQGTNGSRAKDQNLKFGFQVVKLTDKANRRKQVNKKKWWIENCQLQF